MVPRPCCATARSGPGMVQLWIDAPTPRPAAAPTWSTSSGRRCPDGWLDRSPGPRRRRRRTSLLVHADDPRLPRMAVLDVVINNADRKGGHALDGVDGAIYGVDHGICLHTDPKLRTVLWGWAGEPRPPAHCSPTLDDLRRRPRRRSGEVLAVHLTVAEVDALAARVQATLSAALPLPAPRGPFRGPRSDAGASR